FCRVQVECISKVRSTRSRKYGIQPVPPSESAIFRSGKSLMGRDHSRSAAAETMFIGCSVINTSGGESIAGIESVPDDPMWMDITLWVSHRAHHGGFEWGWWKLG